MSQLFQDIHSQQIHIPKKIMMEVWEIDANPRPATLELFLQYNYPEYLNESDFIWNNFNTPASVLRDILKSEGYQ